MPVIAHPAVFPGRSVLKATQLDLEFLKYVIESIMLPTMVDAKVAAAAAAV